MFSLLINRDQCKTKPDLEIDDNVKIDCRNPYVANKNKK